MLSVDWLFLISAPFVGSFIAAVAWRMEHGFRFVLERSKCPACDTVLQPMDLIPVVSWLLLSRRCRYCQSHISIYYPAIETIALLIAIWAILALPSGAVFRIGCGLAWALLALSVIDIKTMRLPDLLTLPLAVIGAIVAWYLQSEDLLSHCIAAIVAILGLVLLRMAFLRWRGRDVLGSGDVKLIAVMAIWLGPLGLASGLFLASISGLSWFVLSQQRQVQKAVERQIPFGPFLSFGFWIGWLYGPIRFFAPF